MPRFAPLAAMALAAAAGAQPPLTFGTTVTYSWAWQESDANGVPVGIPNGVLEPGESSLIRLAISFTNQNTTASYTPPTPNPGSGTIRGFAFGFFDLNGSGGAQGTWNTDPALGLGIDPAWDLVGPPGWGAPANGGASLTSLQFGQFPVNAAAIITTNPIPDIWQGVWTPASYTARSVTFEPYGASKNGGQFAVMFATGTSGVAGIFCFGTFGSLSIGIVPAPAAPLILITPFFMRRRRRRTDSAPP